MKKNKFLKEINSLRAISIIAVLAYHSDIKIFGTNLSGGYLGVDIFFVISGFLISSYLYKEITINKKIDLISFYLKRAKRIFPLILFSTCLTCLIGFFFLIPNQIESLIESAISQFLFVSNYFFFLSGNGYFRISENYVPLLHFWSLSVEEQFYFFFPLFLILIFRFKLLNLKNLVFFFLFLTTITTFSTFYFKEFSFYSISSRCFEFLLGFICLYLKVHYRNKLDKLKIFYLDILGLLIILTCFFLFSKHTLHPSFFTLIPLFGCCLIVLFTNYNSIFYKFFTSKPIQFVGFISFSLYVWHYPLFIFVKNTGIITQNNEFKLYLFIILFFLSTISYLFIEKPFRYNERISNKFFIVFSILMILINFFIFSHVLQKSNSNNNIILDKISTFIPLEDNKKLINNTYSLRECANRINDFCKIVKDEKYTNVIFLGDSMVQQLIPEFIHRDLNINIYDLSYSGMIYLKNFERIINNKSTASLMHHENRLNIINKLEKKIVIIFGRYNYINNNNEYKKINQLSKLSFEEELKQSIDQILNSNIEKLVLIYPSPEYNFNVLNEIKVNFIFDKKGTFIEKRKINQNKNNFMNNNKLIFSLFDSFNDNKIIKIYPHKLFCDEELCYTHSNDEIYYRDDVHFSEFQIKNLNDEIVNESFSFKY